MKNFIIQKQVLPLLVLGVACIIAIIAITGSLRTTSLPITGGFVDLSDWGFEKNGVIELNGEWEFYWNQLLNPADFSTKEARVHSLITVPSHWGGTKYNQNGYGTYRLRLHLPPGKFFGLSSRQIETAYKIWFNGSLIAESGTVATDPKVSKPQYLFALNFFPVDKEESELVIQVSNFEHFRGGIKEPIWIGLAGDIVEKVTSLRAIHYIIAGLIGFCLINGLFLYSCCNEKRYLYYSFICGCIVAYIFLLVEGLPFRLYPDIDWDFYMKIIAPSFLLSAWFYHRFILETFPTVFSKSLSQLFQWALVPLLAPLLLFRFVDLLHVVSAMYCYIGLILLHIGWGLGLATWRKLPLSKFYLGLFIFLAAAVAIDLYSITTGGIRFRLVPFGTLIFLVLHYYTMSVEHAHTQQIAEQRRLALADLQGQIEQKERELNFACEEMQRCRVNGSGDSWINERLIYDVSKKPHKMRSYGGYGSGQALESSNERQIDTEVSQNQWNYLKYLAYQFLGPVRNSLELLRNLPGRIPVKTGKQLNSIKLALSPLERVVNNGLCYSHLQAKATVLNPQPLDLGQYVEDAISALGAMASLKGLTLVNEISKATIFVHADGVALIHILENLIDNAVKFTNTGKITVNATLDEVGPQKMVKVSVIDTGVGIAAHKIEQLTSDLSLWDRGFSDQTVGLKLGLSLVRTFVGMHKGVFAVQSREGHGSNFTFSLPIIEANVPVLQPFEKGEERVQSASEERTLLNGRKARGSGSSSEIILVESDPGALCNLVNHLEPLGVNLTTFHSSLEADAYLSRRERNSGLVLLASTLPLIEGEELLERIRRRYTYDCLPIIMTGGRVSESSVSRAFEKGANAYLAKPFNWAEVHRMVEVFRSIAEYSHKLEKLESETWVTLKVIQGNLDRLLCVEACDGGVLLHFNAPVGATQYFNIPLHVVEAHFERRRELVRAGRSFLVNPMMVQHLRRKADRGYRVQLKNSQLSIDIMDESVVKFRLLCPGLEP